MTCRVVVEVGVGATRARLWPPPPAKVVIAVPVGRLTSTGVLLLVVVPSPNSPSLL